MRQSTGTALIIALATLGACVRNITPAEVQKIEVCQTTHAEMREMFGKPDVIGQLGGRPTWTYTELRGEPKSDPRLIVLFDKGSIVSDVAYNPQGLVELTSRCGPPPAPPGPPVTPVAPAPAADGCDPPCSPGYRCEQGQCAAVCNPPCSPGMRCNQERVCAPEPSAEQP